LTTLSIKIYTFGFVIIVYLSTMFKYAIEKPSTQLPRKQLHVKTLQTSDTPDTPDKPDSKSLLSAKIDAAIVAAEENNVLLIEQLLRDDRAELNDAVFDLLKKQRKSALARIRINKRKDIFESIVAENMAVESIMACAAIASALDGIQELDFIDLKF
jgi:hypothetical protein